ncbi:hypothetical protein, partial [Capnocytophaga sp. oral taxon 380]|uniref:hypothetical protein n=1 Tax=Capnocytophaga sp. oral taxon 380 TaxID=712217 RepID=UPI0002A43277
KAKNGKKRVSRRKKKNPLPNNILSYSETSPKERGSRDEGRVTKKGSNDEGRMTNEEGRDRQMTKEQ